MVGALANRAKLEKLSEVCVCHFLDRICNLVNLDRFSVVRVA